MNDRLRNLIFPPPVILAVTSIAVVMTVLAPSSRGTSPAQTAQVEGALEGDGSTGRKYVGFEAAPLSLRQLDAIAEKSLFLQSRRPWKSELVEAEPEVVQPAALPGNTPDLLTSDPPPPTRPDLQLLGTVVGESSFRVLTLNTRTGAETWFEKGTVIEGWTVAELQGLDLILRSGSEEMLVRFNR